MGTIDDKLTERLKEEDKRLAVYNAILGGILDDGMWLAQFGDEILCYSKHLIRSDDDYLPQQAMMTERARGHLQNSLGEMYAQYQPVVDRVARIEHMANNGARGTLRAAATVTSWLSLSSSYDKFFARKIDRCVEKRNEYFQLSDLARHGVEFFAAQTINNPARTSDLERCKDVTKEIADIYRNMGRVYERIARRYAEITDILS